jgi:hypothetical protein
MERSITLNGTQANWMSTGVAVRRGEIFDVRASGEIQFAWGGWGRNPDGCDHTGRSEAPARNWDSKEWGVHPAGSCVKNSLVLRVGNTLLQGGTYRAHSAPEDGEILVSCNDNHPQDNKGAWTVHLRTGLALYQQLLFVVQAPKLAPNLESQLRNLEKDIMGVTGRLLRPQFRIVHVPQPVSPAEFHDYGDKLRFIAFYSRAFHDHMVRQHRLDPRAFDGIIRLYDHPASHPTGFVGNTWKFWSDNKDFGYAQGNLPGYIAMPLQTNRPDALGLAVLHEYLHMLDHRFEEVGVPQFANPDDRWKNAIPPGDKADTSHGMYYMNMLRMLENRATPVPFGRLHGRFGKVLPAT